VQPCTPPRGWRSQPRHAFTPCHHTDSKGCEPYECQSGFRVCLAEATSATFHPAVVRPRLSGQHTGCQSQGSWSVGDHGSWPQRQALQRRDSEYLQAHTSHRCRLAAEGSNPMSQQNRTTRCGRVQCCTPATQSWRRPANPPSRRPAGCTPRQPCGWRRPRPLPASVLQPSARQTADLITAHDMRVRVRVRLGVRLRVGGRVWGGQGRDWGRVRLRARVGVG
jgi:hypothetical protein